MMYVAFITLIGSNRGSARTQVACFVQLPGGVTSEQAPMVWWYGKYVFLGTRLVFSAVIYCRRSLHLEFPHPRVRNTLTETIFRSKLKTHHFSSNYVV